MFCNTHNSILFLIIHSLFQLMSVEGHIQEKRDQTTQCTSYFMCSSIFLEETNAFCTPALVFRWLTRFLVLQHLHSEHQDICSHGMKEMLWSWQFSQVLFGICLGMAHSATALASSMLSAYLLLSPFPPLYSCCPNMHSCYMWLVIRAFGSHLETLFLQKPPARTEIQLLPGGGVLVQPRTCTCYTSYVSARAYTGSSSAIKGSSAPAKVKPMDHGCKTMSCITAVCEIRGRTAGNSIPLSPYKTSMCIGARPVTPSQTAVQLDQTSWILARALPPGVNLS